LALAAFGLLENRTATCYPGFEEHFPASATHDAESPVVADGNLVTSRGPGTAFPFALALVEQLVDKQTAAQLARGMQFAS